MGLFDKAKDMASNPENVEKAKGALTDENVDAAGDKLKGIAPDQADGAIDGLSDKAKEFGGGEGEGGGGEGRGGEGGRGEGGRGEGRGGEGRGGQ